MQDTAIAIFCFDRPDSLSRLLNSLLSSQFLDELPLYIFIDSARSESETEKIQATHSIAEAFPHPMKTIVRREYNMGLKLSLTKGIDEVLLLHKAAIVLEDDLVLGRFALDYFLRALTECEEKQQVVSICGYAIGVLADAASNGAHFLPMTHPWGWATWRDRWQAYRARTADTTVKRSASFVKNMNVFGLRNYVNMLIMTERGFLDSWWIYWQANAIDRHTVSLFPKQSHVVNMGLHAGTHASGLNLLMKAMPKKILADSATNIPEEVLVDFNALDQIISSREARLLRVTGALGAIRRKVERIAKW